jgi:hypothetical protein
MSMRPVIWLAPMFIAIKETYAITKRGKFTEAELDDTDRILTASLMAT